MTITHSPMGVLHLASSVVAMLVGDWFVAATHAQHTGLGVAAYLHGVGLRRSSSAELCD
jgi:hypothetical protein